MFSLVSCMYPNIGAQETVGRLTPLEFRKEEGLEKKKKLKTSNTSVVIER